MSDVEAALAALAARFVTRAAEDLQTLSRWSDAGGNPDDEHRRLLHRLAGAAGTFGFHALSARAAEAEDTVAAGANGGAQLRSVLQELAQVAEGARKRVGSD